MDNQETFSLGVKRIPFNGVMRKARLEKGLSQYDLGKMIGACGSTIQQIETMRKWPKTNVAYQIADILEVDIENLFPKWMEDKLVKRGSNLNVYMNIERVALEAAASVPSLLSGSDVVDKEIDRKLMEKNIREVLDTISPKERRVLVERFGLYGNEPKDLEAVGRMFNVTRERIRQIEAKALRKLRHPSRSNGLKDYVS